MKRWLGRTFPFLKAWRRKLKIALFYRRMRRDGNIYAIKQSGERLPYQMFETQSVMINENSGQDIIYQQNKVFNLKLAAKKLDGLCILPGETFSFWQRLRDADKYEKYLNGLCLEDGKIVPSYGGGLCQMSNLLYWAFLHTPLTVTERHTHRVKSFPSPPGDDLEGVDATVNEGWLDLKAKNDTKTALQIVIDFDETHIICRILSEEPPTHAYVVYTENLQYTKAEGKTYQAVDVYRKTVDYQTAEVTNTFLYHNTCEIGYPLEVEA